MMTLQLIPGWTYLRSAWTLASTRMGIALIALLVGWYSGYRHAEHKADVASLQAQIAILKQDASFARQAEQSALIQTEALARHLIINQEKVDALAADLKTRDRGSCAVSERDARRLRSIR
jgi:phage-related minor tail protein